MVGILIGLRGFPIVISHLFNYYLKHRKTNIQIKFMAYTEGE